MIEDGVTIEPANLSNSNNPEEQNLVKEGERSFEAGDIAKAEELFILAAEECPGNVQALNNLAVVSLTKGDKRAALGHLKSAVEIKPDFLEARYNLAELYILDSKWSKAVKELENILAFKPGDLPTIKRLAQVYVSMGQEEKAKELLSDSDNIAAMKAFINSLWLGIKFYSMAEGLSTKDRLEKLMLAVLKLIDGQDGRSQAFKLVGEDPDDGREIILENLAESFYYQESSDLSGEARAGDPEKPELILTIGDHEDWRIFHDALKAEMRAEGGCLGDFTQTRKVLRQQSELQKYNLDLTLKYFQSNVGPCDCHVLRAVLV
ncbi:MAG: tetratricopeptide repeat protein [Deltaproteobacteria bacterium]|jgi:tetratricopeptide (TPR) repeat protein|nr:tetratricopeptide repeat protein [Deltaproteobacteria bacterium]